MFRGLLTHARPPVHAAALAPAHALGTPALAWLTIVRVRVPCAERGRLLLGGVCGSGGATTVRTVRPPHAPRKMQWQGAFHAVGQRTRYVCATAAEVPSRAAAAPLRWLIMPLHSGLTDKIDRITFFIAAHTDYC